MSANKLPFNISATHFYHFSYALNGESNDISNTNAWGRHPTVNYVNNTICELPCSERSRPVTSIYTAYTFSLQFSIRVAAVKHIPSHFNLVLLSCLIHLTWPSCETNPWADIKFTLQSSSPRGGHGPCEVTSAPVTPEERCSQVINHHLSSCLKLKILHSPLTR